MRKYIIAVALLSGISSIAMAQNEKEAAPFPSPNAIVDTAPASEWIAIKQSDLMVMDLAPDRDGKKRRVIIQLMPEPFSQGWIRNIRKLAAARYWDDTAIIRVQDNYVTQWGDPNSGEEGAKPLPDDLEIIPESEYYVDGDILSEVEGELATTEREAESNSNIQRSEGKHNVIDNEELSSDDLNVMLDELDDALKEIEIKRAQDDAIYFISTRGTKSAKAPYGWHNRDSFTEWVEIYRGWALGNIGVDDEAKFWPVHCYGMVGVGRDLSPNTGDGSSLYTVIGHAPRHLDRNIALVGRIISGMEHMSSLPRGTGDLGFYETPEERTKITSVRMGYEVSDVPSFEYLDTRTLSFAKYTNARANRRDPFFNVPAGGADICNIPVPIRVKKDAAP